MIYDKLARDRTPEIIADSGRTAVVGRVSGEALERALVAKLIEEAGELGEAAAADAADADDADDARLGELIDVFEVVRGLAHHLGITMELLTQRADQRRDERGGFERGVWLHSVADD